MSVEALQVLHRRYVDLSQRFRAAWVYHQFLQGLAKVFLDGFDNRYPAEFQNLYAELKETSQSLNTSEADRLPVRFEAIDRRLAELIDALRGEDTRVDPATLRQFFSRTRSYDEKILIQLLRFYLLSHSGGPAWEPDLLDKVDFLATRLAEDDSAAGETLMRDRRHLMEVFQSLAVLLEGSTPPPAMLESRRREVAGIRGEVASALVLDDFHDHQLVARFRALKHALGPHFFHPDLLCEIVETNIVFKNTVRTLYHREERRIFTEYQQIFDLERDAQSDGELDVELAEFRRDVERFEKQLQRDEIRLEQLAVIRRRVRDLMPRLAGRPGAEGKVAPVPRQTTGELAAAIQSRASPAPPLSPPSPEPGEGLLDEHYQRLLSALEGTTSGASPRAVLLTPDLFPYRLESREVVAFRRLAGGAPTGAGAVPVDPESERFLLRAAALRVKLAEEQDEIRALLDDTIGDPRAPIFDRSRRTAQLADVYLARFEHHVRRSIVEGRGDEARQLELLRMRLMKEYADLWLLAYRRLLQEGSPAS